MTLRITIANTDKTILVRSAFIASVLDSIYVPCPRVHSGYNGLDHGGQRMRWLLRCEEAGSLSEASIRARLVNCEELEGRGMMCDTGVRGL
jgi:hypothetical protein